MKIGAENKTKVRWMIALLVVVALVVIYDFVDFGTSSAAPPATTTAAATAQKKIGQAQAEDSSLDPRWRIDKLAASQQIKYEAGRNIFRMEAVPIPPMEGSARVLAPMGPDPPPTPTPTPPPPPIPLKFYGFANKPNEPKKVFLADADEVFVAKQGDIVERKYKVVQINNNNVIIEDLLYNNRQPIQMSAPPAAGAR
ncbi:MAG TPA: hypothetical protein VIB39_08085 [Candidatus Angelobacter sp.]